MNNFARLDHAARVCHGRFPFLVYVTEWHDKRQMAGLYLRDIPELVSAWTHREESSYKGNDRLLTSDPIPGLRLAAACEGLANTIYSMCDIAAVFACKASNGIFASSFNRILRQASAADSNHPSWFDAATFKHYALIREIRTEWTHHSTVFVARREEQPILVVKPMRRKGDRLVLPEKALVSIPDLLTWSARAVEAIDAFGIRVWTEYVLPHVDTSMVINELVYDENGMPKFQGDGKALQMRKTTLHDYFARASLTKPLSDNDTGR